jgi:hypothetical protein
VHREPSEFLFVGKLCLSATLEPKEVQAMDVASWLGELGLECYVAAFASNDVTANVLPHLSSDDLKELPALSNGLKIAREHNDLLVLADLQRLRGRLLLKQDRRGDAQCALIEAIETARRQGPRAI